MRSCCYHDETPITFPTAYAWFAFSISIWSTLLTLRSIHVLCQDRARFWGAAARVSCVVYTILATCVSTPHYKFRFYGRWVAFAILRLSLVALTQSLYWLIRGEKQTGPKNSLTERTEPTKRNHPGNAPVSATPTFFHPPPVVRSYNDSAR
jgi:hypothetical protein